MNETFLLTLRKIYVRFSIHVNKTIRKLEISYVKCFARPYVKKYVHVNAASKRLLQRLDDKTTSQHGL